MDEEEDDTATPVEVGRHPMSDTDDDDLLLATAAWSAAGGAVGGGGGSRTPGGGVASTPSLQPPTLLLGGPGGAGRTPGADDEPLIDLETLYMSWTAWCMYFCRIAGTEPELETIKKCTPLYGQPSWWGEELHEEEEELKDAAAASQPQATPTATPSHCNHLPDRDRRPGAERTGAERPTSLALERPGGSEGSADTVDADDMSKYKQDPRYAALHMDPPQRDGDKNQNGGGGNDSPPESEVTTGSDHHRQRRSSPSGVHTPPEKDVSPPPASDDKSASAKSGPMAFTIDLGDDMGGTPKLNMKNSLSEFLPHKVRRSFRSRSAKGSRKGSEEKEDSPASGKASRDGSPMRHARSEAQYHSDGGQNSAVSSDNEDISIRSDTVTTRELVSGQGISFGLMFMEADVPPPPPMFTYNLLSAKRSSSSPRTRSTARVARRERSQQQQQGSSTSRTAPVDRTARLRQQPTSTTDSTNYLIDRMFNQSTGRTRSRDLGSANEDTASPPTGSPVMSPSKRSPLSSAVALAERKWDSTTSETSRTRSSRSRDIVSSVGGEDNVSESGTYTIESEFQSSEVAKARQSIDAVFGIDDGLPPPPLLRPSCLLDDVNDEYIDKHRGTSDVAQTNGDVTAGNDDSGVDDGVKIVNLSGSRTFERRRKLTTGTSMDVEVGSTVNDDEVREDVEDDEDYKIVEVLFDGVWASPKLTRRTPEVHSYQPEVVATQPTEDTPKWVSQWATLATQKTFVKSPTLTTNAPIYAGRSASDVSDVRSSSESARDFTPAPPPERSFSGPGRKPRGSGRKLPTPPVKSSCSSTPMSPRSTTAPSSEALSETPEKDASGTGNAVMTESGSRFVTESGSGFVTGSGRGFVSGTGSSFVSSTGNERGGVRNRPTAYIDPRRPDNIPLTSASSSSSATAAATATATTTEAIDDILTHGVTSDVVTFVHDEMSESITTEMTDSATSSHLSASMGETRDAEGEEDEEEEEELSALASRLRTVLRGKRSSPEVVVCPVSGNTNGDALTSLRDTDDVIHAMPVRMDISLDDLPKDKSVKRTTATENGSDDTPLPPQTQPQRKSTELFIPLHDDDSDSDGSNRALMNGHPPRLKPKPRLFKSHSTDTRKPPSTRPFLSREQRERERASSTGSAGSERSSSSAVKESPRAGATSRDGGKPTSTIAGRGSPKIKPPPSSASAAATASRARSVQKQPPQQHHQPQKQHKSEPQNRHQNQQKAAPSTPHKIPKDATFVCTDSGRGKSSVTSLTSIPSLDLNSSFGSDLHSESESIVSSSTDYSGTLSPRLARRGSKGKAPMSMTRPNRAFALRRARLDGEEPPTPPTPPSSSSATTNSTSAGRYRSNVNRARPNSAGARDTPRPRPSSARDSGRSDVGVRAGGPRSRESSVGPPRAKSTGPRLDTGRLTARHEKKGSTSSTGGSQPRKSPAPPPCSSSSMRHKSDRLSSTGSGGTRSKPSSRSNSPQTPSRRSEEYSAWKRRKSYDPRQAVVNAKVKARELRNSTSDSQSATAPERSRSAGPLARVSSTVSSVSSEESAFLQEELQSYAGGGRHHRASDAISQVSNAVCHQVDAMSRSIESDDAFVDVGGKLSYDTVMVNSIYQLSLKVRTQTDKIMEKMRDRSQLNASPSPTDDVLSPPPSMESDLSGYKNANQELASILRNLSKTERHLQIIDRALFPSKQGTSSPGSPKDHEQYLRELERIRTEISGFRPIEDPEPENSSRSSRQPLTKQQSRDSDATDLDITDPLASDEYY